MGILQVDEYGPHRAYLIGPDTPESISCLAMDGDAIWVSAGPFVLKYIRGKEVRISELSTLF